MRRRNGLFGSGVCRLLGLLLAIAAGCCVAASGASAAQTINTIAVGEEPSSVSSDGTHVWVTNSFDGTVSEIQASTGTVIHTITVGTEPGGVSSNGTTVWVANYGSDTVSEIQVSTAKVIHTLAVGKKPAGVSATGSDVWVANSGSNTVTEIKISNEEGNPEVIHTINVGNTPTGISANSGIVWVANTESNTVSSIFERSEEEEEEGEEPSVFETYNTGPKPTGIAGEGFFVWVAISGEKAPEVSENVVEEIGVISIFGRERVSVGEVPTGVSSDGTHVWVANGLGGTLSEIDSSNLNVVATVEVGSLPAGVSSDGSHVWVADSGEAAVSEVAIPPAPSVSITSPNGSTLYHVGESVAAKFTCTEGAGGPGLKPGTEGCKGSVANGSNIDTSKQGPQQVVVTATSQDGEVTVASVEYKVTGPPLVSIFAPAEGATYQQNATVAASFSCIEGDFGPGLKPGSEGCKGTVENGANIETATTGEHKFKVTGASKDGETTEKSVTYHVAAGPTITLVAPTNGATYARGAAVPAEFSCSDGAGGPGLKPGTEGCKGTVENGNDIETSTGGERSFKVTAVSKDGQFTEKIVKYKVIGGPSVSITSPTEGAKYKKAQTVLAAFTCKEGEGGPGLKPGTEGCSGTVPVGTAINTATGGEHTFTVIARSKSGAVAEKTVTYHVTAPPVVNITSPTEGATYKRGQVVTAAYSCADGEGGPGLKPGREGCRGTLENGRTIDTTGVREHTFTVIASSKDGQITQKTVKYKVIAAPTVMIITPTQGATYRKGASVLAVFLCKEGEGGPGLKPGTEGCSGTVPYRQKIDTSVAGEHVFKVTATSKDGQVTEKTVTYNVRAPLL
ncbi:MAG TPA: YncE family protein [Solirubrobacteraceae bacterium]|nr:YncE family protein [Solirubrobacteraceae bacterium]